MLEAGFLEVDYLEESSKESFHQCVEIYGSPPPHFTDQQLIWAASRTLFGQYRIQISNYLRNHPDKGMVMAWRELFSKALLHTATPDDPCTSLFTTETAAQLCRCGMQFSRTPPSIFGDNYKDQEIDGERSAILALVPLEDDASEETIRNQRNDMVIWAAAHEFFGRAWDFLSVESSRVPDASAEAFSMSNGEGDKFVVSQGAKDSLAFAMDSMANKPKPFERNKYVVTAVAKILGADMLEYSFPQTQDDLNIDFADITWNNDDTFPKGKSPTSAEFEKVRTVHQAIKDEKNAQAKLSGGEGYSQSYITFKQKWSQWRDLCAVYRWMNPTSDLQVVLSKMTIDLKCCTSEKKLVDAVKQAVNTHIEKLKKEKAKKELESRRAAAAAAATKASQEAAAARERQNKIVEEQRVAAEAAARDAEAAKSRELQVTVGNPGPAEETGGTEVPNKDQVAASQGAVSQDASSQAAEHQAALFHHAARAELLERQRQGLGTLFEEEEEEITRQKAISDSETRRRLDEEKRIEEEAAKRLADKKRELEEIDRQQADWTDDTVATPQKKRAPMNDIRLLNRDSTPRDKASADPAWAPPTKSTARILTYHAPGEKWAMASKTKLSQLFALCTQLENNDYLEVPMTFYTVIDFITTDSSRLDFNSKVFLYLIALVLVEDANRYAINMHAVYILSNVA